MTLITVKVAAVVLYPIVEYWLGKTKKLKSNSVLELILECGMSVLKVIRNKGEEKHE